MRKINCWEDPNYSDLWIFAIETDSYTGNFELELSGFITGVPPDYDPSPEAEDYCKTFKLNPDECLESWGNEYEFMRCEHAERVIFSMFAFDGSEKHNNGVAIYLNTKPEQCQIDRIKQRTLEFAKKWEIKILKFRLIHRTVQVNETELNC